MQRIIILDNIRSVYNVGSILKVADGAGVSFIYLVGITPGPKDRFGRERKDFAKTALGAQTSIKFAHIKNTDKESLTLSLKEDNFKIFSIEQHKNSNIFDQKYLSKIDKVAYIFGSETNGVSDIFVKFYNGIFELPMKGIKNSLNVSTSVSSVLYSELLCK